MKPKTRRTVCLLSPHPLVLEEFRWLLSSSGLHVQAHQLESTLAPDLHRLAVSRASVYVLDAHLPRLATGAVAASILDRFPAARLLVLAEKFSETNAFPLLRLGVKGLLSYAEARQNLPRALEAIAMGGFWAPRALLSRFMDSILTSRSGRRLATGRADLSDRERQVLEALLENLSNKEIASKLHISERTVKFHVSNLLSKFGVQRRHHLIQQCWQARPGS
jgi:DNA-binding NarL/FixJ family response regulator